MENFDQKSILEMGKGAILERVDYEMGKIIENILDINTPADAVRTLTVTLKIKPSSDRRQFAASTTAKCGLVATNPITSSFSFVTDPGTGEQVVIENTPVIPGQMSLVGGEQEQPKVLKISKLA